MPCAAWTQSLAAALTTAVVAACAGPVAGASAAGVEARFGAAGLERLSYQGTTLLDVDRDPRDGFRVDGFRRRSPLGARDVAGSEGPPVVTGDALARTVRWSYDWGFVEALYEVRDDRLVIEIRTVNRTAADTIEGTWLTLGRLHFPQPPRGFDGDPQIRSTTRGPGVVAADYGTAAVAVVNENVTTPLNSGFMTDLDTATAQRSGQVFHAVTLSAPVWYQPAQWDRSTAPVPPGQVRTPRISLRFGPAGAAAHELAPDVYRRYAEAHPAVLRWPDRRPIGALYLARSHPQPPPGNPRGWFGDTRLDIRTARGRRSFERRLLAYADASVAELLRVGAQGAIVWDVEGQEHPHPVSYLGDPRRLAEVAPEMEPIVDEFFARFRRAGLRVGVTVRPQRLVVGAAGARQEPAADPAAELIEKIDYARRRWGATLFHVDSNGGPADPLSADVMRRVALAACDSLLVPEHENDAYFGMAAPWTGAAGRTSASTRAAYAGGFSVSYAPDAGETTGELAQTVANGDVLMFRAWYRDPHNDRVREAYAAARTTAPASPTGCTNPTPAPPEQDLTTFLAAG